MISIDLGSTIEEMYKASSNTRKLHKYFKEFNTRASIVDFMLLYRVDNFLFLTKEGIDSTSTYLRKCTKVKKNLRFYFQEKIYEVLEKPNAVELLRDAVVECYNTPLDEKVYGDFKAEYYSILVEIRYCSTIVENLEVLRFLTSGEVFNIVNLMHYCDGMFIESVVRDVICFDKKKIFLYLFSIISFPYKSVFGNNWERAYGRFLDSFTVEEKIYIMHFNIPEDVFKYLCSTL